MQVESFPSFLRALDLAPDDPFTRCLQTLYENGLIDQDIWSVRLAEQKMWVIFRQRGASVPTPDNQLVPDKRTTKYQPPFEREDPFLASGIATDLPQKARLLARRYLIVGTISANIQHTVSLAVDVEQQRTCIIKSSGHPWQHALPESERQYLRREAQVLQALGPHPRIPEFFDLLEDENNSYLVMSDVPGELLMERLNKELVTDLLPFQQILIWAIDLAEVLDAIHHHGFVYADLKPTNVIIGPDGQCYLVDFELAARLGTPGNQRLGTRGYISPQQNAGQPHCITDDIYSFGALLYLLVTGVEASHAPDPTALLARPVELLRPDVPPALQAIIERCLQPYPEKRYADMTELLAALRTLPEGHLQQNHCDEETITRRAMSEAQARERAMALLQTLCATAQETGQGNGLTWKTKHPVANDYALRDLNVGHAGTLLALAALTAELKLSGARDVLARGADALCAMPPHSDPPLPGLYVGEAGVGAALLLAGQVLEDETLIARVVERSQCISRLPHTSPDITHGTAGRLLFHLLVWEETREQEHLAFALACGEQLVQLAQVREPGEVCWTLAGTIQGFSQSAYPGYAHGVAGIADALLDLFEVTGDERLQPVILGAARWLQRLAIPVLMDQSGLNWPHTEEEKRPFLAHWCHGATGVGHFFLHASRHSWVPGALDIAIRAARTVTRLTRFGGPTLCHGLAGSIEFLLDLYQETHDTTYLVDARTFGVLLEAFATKDAEDHLVFYTDQYNIVSPDYQVGYAGIMTSLLRLSTPDRIPMLLSRAGFRAYKHAAKTSSAIHSL